MPDTFFKQEFPNGHFYSPYPSIADVEKHAVGSSATVPLSLTGIDPAADEQWKLWDSFAKLAADSYLNCEQRMADARYTFENGMFNRCDAASLHCFLRHFQPRRVIEIGSGFTSFVTLDTREHHTAGIEEFTLIEPYPQRLEQRLKPRDLAFCDIRRVPLQEIDPDLFASLNPGDLLFIDSTHVCKSGSDVLYAFCEILPRLAPGVRIHFHDIFWPFEYPMKWYEKGRAWNETFLLRSLLANCSDYRILIHPHFLMCADRQRFTSNAWHFATSGGSIYLEKTAHGR